MQEPYEDWWSMMSDAFADPPLSAQTAATALEKVCRIVGLDSNGATLLGPVGDNAVFRLPAAGVVARLTRASVGIDRLRREVRIAHWLAAQDFPAVRVAPGIDEPIAHDRVAASFWEEIPDLAQASAAEIGQLLRLLHQLPPPPNGLLSQHDPFSGQREHIAAAALPTEERAFLARQLDTLEEMYPRLRYNWPVGVVHGDAHRKNVVRSGHDRVLLLDLERFGLGHREWDVVVPAVYRRVGWYSEQEYEDFVKAYGFDITKWEGYSTLAAVRELRMTTWLAARTGREPRLIPEARKRIASLKDQKARNWVPGE